MIGDIRRALFIRGTWKWNAWVRDVTAWVEAWLGPRKEEERQVIEPGLTARQENDRSVLREQATLQVCGEMMFTTESCPSSKHAQIELVGEQAVCLEADGIAFRGIVEARIRPTWDEKGVYSGEKAALVFVPAITKSGLRESAILYTAGPL